MKASIFTTAIVTLLLFAINFRIAKADSDDTMYHNVEQIDNTTVTTYYKNNERTGSLVPFKKRINTMNEEGLCIIKETYEWDRINEEWIPLDKTEYTYEDEKVTSVGRYAWSKALQDWDEPQTVTYRYDLNGVSAK